MPQPTVSQPIQQAANLIRTLDPSAADAFVDKPFSRHLIVTALHAQLAALPQFAHIADHVAVALRSSIDADQRLSNAA